MLFEVSVLSAKRQGKDYATLNRWWARKDFRSTTENVAGIASMAKALRLVTDKEVFSSENCQDEKIIFDELAKYEDITIFSGEGEDFAPNILTFGIKGCSEKLLSML